MMKYTANEMSIYLTVREELDKGSNSWLIRAED